MYSAVQNVAEGSIGSSAIDSLATALETLIRNFERLVSLILSELDVAVIDIFLTFSFVLLLSDIPFSH